MATYQSVTEGDVIVVAPHLERARDSLKAAEMLRDAGLAADSVTRAHQSAIHAERALLATSKRSPQTPRDVHRMCSAHFLGTDLLDRSHAAKIDGLGTLRQRADDVPASDVSADDASGAHATAAAFLADVEGWLAENGYS